MNDNKNEVPIDQRFSVLYFDKAVEQMQNNGNLDNMEPLNMAIMLDPTYYQAYYLRGLNWLRLSEEDLAKEDFNKCISIAPEFADVFISLGFIAYENGDYSKANNLFDKGIQLNKESGIGYLFKGMVFDQMNVPSGAKLYYEKAKVLLNDDGNLIFLNEFLNNIEE
jgi:Tfp pilus assembly protein PilF